MKKIPTKIALLVLVAFPVLASAYGLANRIGGQGVVLRQSLNNPPLPSYTSLQTPTPPPMAVTTTQPPVAPRDPLGVTFTLDPSGNYLSYLSPSVEPTFANVNEMVLASDLIVVATALDNDCGLTPNGTFITTDYKVSVMKVLKGSLATNHIISVSLPGGRALLKTLPKIDYVNTTGLPPTPSGPTFAEVRVPWFKKMTKGKTYILFLTGNGILNQKYNLKTFEPTGGPQGVFEVTDAGVTLSCSGRQGDPAWQYHNMSAATFIGMIKAAQQPQSIS